MFSGRLDVPNGTLGIEGFLHNGRTYTYFGVWPSIIRMPVLLVTHSPQVAARGATHWRVAKFADDGRAETRVEALAGDERQEEIARMLAGEIITDAARAAAASLMGSV